MRASPSTYNNNNNNNSPMPGSSNHGRGDAAAAALQPGEPRVKVCCRVRPLSPREAGGHGIAIRLFPQDPTSLAVSGTTSAGKTMQRYTMDRVFSEDATQTDVFDEIAAPLVRAACAGHNAALFAYGQTGSGKTHSMLGLDVWQLFASKKSEMTLQQRQALERSEQRGVIPRAMQLTFDLLKDRQHKISVSYLEIYNEKILDLLVAADNGGNAQDSKSLEIREDKSGQIQVLNATLRRVHTLDEVMDALWRGARNRSVGSTDVNEHSSRSHTIFQVVIETRGTNTVKGTKAKLNLVDLAGSEKWRPHQLQEFTEQRLLEMTSINQSLSNLGQCVRGLLQPGRHHIPYRNSKLTRLLQDALGSNAQLGFIVCVSPAESSFDETVSTLQFADRAKRIVVREMPSSSESQVVQPQQQQQPVEPPLTLLERLKMRLGDGGGGAPQAAGSDDELVQQHYEQHLPALESYHSFLRSRAVDHLTPVERLTLLEWSILVQAEDFERTRIKYQQDLERSKQQLLRLKQAHADEAKDKDAELDLLRVEIKAALAEAKSKSQQLADMKALMDAASTSVSSSRGGAAAAAGGGASNPASIGGARGSSEMLKQNAARASSPNVARVPSSSAQQPSAMMPVTPQPLSQPSRATQHQQQQHNATKHDNGVLPEASENSRDNRKPRPNMTSSAMMESPSLLSASFRSSRFSSPAVLQHKGMALSPSVLHTTSGSRASPALSSTTSNAWTGAPKPSSTTTVATTAPLMWESFLDPKSMRPYYYCKSTGVTQWTRPEGFV